jgi:hypothetical protein
LLLSLPVQPVINKINNKPATYFIKTKINFEREETKKQSLVLVLFYAQRVCIFGAGLLYPFKSPRPLSPTIYFQFLRDTSLSNIVMR